MCLVCFDRLYTAACTVTVTQWLIYLVGGTCNRMIMRRLGVNSVVTLSNHLIDKEHGSTGLSHNTISDRNRLHHLALLAGFLHGLRVSETLAIKGRDILDAKLSVKRLKKSLPTLHRLRFDSDPLFDESPLIELAKVNSGRLFDWSRQYM